MKFQILIKEAVYSILQSLELFRASQITYSPGMFSPLIPHHIVADILRPKKI